MQSKERLIRACGVALVVAGVLTIVVNVLLTPLLPAGPSFAGIAASPMFLLRQSAAAVAAALLLFGCIGVYLRQMHRWGLGSIVTLVVALLGSALRLATEWIQIFEIRDLAIRVPDVLNRLDAVPRCHPSTRAPLATPSSGSASSRSAGNSPDAKHLWSAPRPLQTFSDLAVVRQL